MKYSSVFVKIGLGLCLPYNLVIDLALAMGLAIPAIVLLNCSSSCIKRFKYHILFSAVLFIRESQCNLVGLVCTLV